MHFKRYLHSNFMFTSLAAKTKPDGKLETCKPIHKIDLKTTRMGYAIVDIISLVKSTNNFKSTARHLQYLRVASQWRKEANHPALLCSKAKAQPY